MLAFVAIFPALTCRGAMAGSLRLAEQSQVVHLSRLTSTSQAFRRSSLTYMPSVARVQKAPAVRGVLMRGGELLMIPLGQDVSIRGKMRILGGFRQAPEFKYQLAFAFRLSI